jgi:hypothetical protein
MRSEYGLCEGQFDEVEAAWLTAAWGRRKRFEAKLLALEVWSLAAGGMAGGVSRETGQYQRVPEAELWSQMGLGPDGRTVS